MDERNSAGDDFLATPPLAYVAYLMDEDASSEAIKRKKLELSKLLIYDAIWGDGSDFLLDESSIRCYKLYRNEWMQFCFSFVNVAFLLVPFVDDICNQGHWIYLSLLYDVTLFLVVTFQYMLTWRFTGWQVVKRNSLFWISAIALFLYPVEWLFRRIPVLEAIYYVQIGDVLRVSLYLCALRSRQVRMALRLVLHLWPLGLTAFTIFILMKLIFGTILWQIFKTKNLSLANGRPYMHTLDDAVWHLVVFSTTVNSPDVILPALHRTQSYLAIFMTAFAIDVILPLIAFAFAMDHFDNHLLKETQRLKECKERLLKRSFDLLSSPVTDRTSTPIRGVSHEMWNDFLDIFWGKCFAAQKDLYFYFLAGTHNNFITEEVFLTNVTNLLLLQVKVKNIRHRLLERILPFYNHGCSLFVRRCILSPMFDYIVYVVIFVNIVLFLLLQEVHLELYFLAFYIMELLLRIYAMGLGPYFANNWNKFDVVIVFGALVVTLMAKQNEHLDGVQMLILVLRMARLARMLRKIPRVDFVFGAVNYVWPGVKTYLILVLLYLILSITVCVQVYASHHLNDLDFNSTNCGQPELNNTDFGNMRYCLMNFNTHTQSLNTLMTLIVANNWHIISQGYEDMTTVWPTRILFLVVVLLCKLMITCLFARLISVVKLYMQVSEDTVHKHLTKMMHGLGLLYIKRPTTSKRSVSVTDGVSGNADDDDPHSLPVEVTGFPLPKCCYDLWHRLFHTVSAKDTLIEMEEEQTVTHREKMTEQVPNSTTGGGTLRRSTQRRSTLITPQLIRNPEGVLFKISKSKRRTEEMILEQSIGNSALGSG